MMMMMSQVFLQPRSLITKSKPGSAHAGTGKGLHFFAIVIIAISIADAINISLKVKARKLRDILCENTQIRRLQPNVMNKVLLMMMMMMSWWQNMKMRQ